MRQALHHAIDRTAIIEAAYFGAGPVSVSLIAPGVLGWRDLEPVPYDPAKARALLTEAEFADGFKSTMTILDAPDQRTSAQIIQANLADVGIQCEILTCDDGTYWHLGLEEMGDDWKELQLILQQWTSSNDPNTTVTWFTPEQIGYWNWQRWNNTEFGELAKKGIAETDAVERDRIYARMVELMNASAAFVPITHSPRRRSTTPTSSPISCPTCRCSTGTSGGSAERVGSGAGVLPAPEDPAPRRLSRGGAGGRGRPRGLASGARRHPKNCLAWIVEGSA